MMLDDDDDSDDDDDGDGCLRLSTQLWRVNSFAAGEMSV